MALNCTSGALILRSSDVMKQLLVSHRSSWVVLENLKKHIPDGQLLIVEDPALWSLDIITPSFSDSAMSQVSSPLLKEDPIV